MADQRVLQAMERIRAYLQSHPTAADSVEGVARYWLGQGAPGPRDILLAGLRGLVAEGVLVEEALPGGQTLFRAAVRDAGRHQP